jgi:DNA-binding MurR/RpiR family transcriptional regulator
MGPRAYPARALRARMRAAAMPLRHAHPAWFADGAADRVTAAPSSDGMALSERIRERSRRFTPSFRKVAEYALAHTHEIAFLPAAKIAAHAGVSESVVVRFAGGLGYAGYPAMQQAAQAFVRSRLSPAARFEAVPITKTTALEDIYRSVLLQDVGNLRSTVEHMANQAVFPKIVKVLLRAGHVYVVGFRGLSYLAGLLTLLLDMAGIEVTLIAHGDATGFQTIRRLKRGDALVAFAFVRYTKATAQMVKLARGRGVTTIVICDSIMARAAHVADVALQASTVSSNFWNSYTAAVACINAIVTALSAKARTRVRQSLRDIDEVLPKDQFDFLGGS